LKCWQLALLTALYRLVDLRYGDESGFSLTPCVPYGWLPKGRQTAIRPEHKPVANVFGLMSLSQDLRYYLTQGNINSDFIIEAIDDFAKTITKPTVIVLDNATWHVSKKVTAKADGWERQGVFLFYRPTYSRHLNPIEILWRKINGAAQRYEWLRPMDYLSKQALTDALVDVLQGFGSKHKIKFLVNKELLI
jgi:transposase